MALLVSTSRENFPYGFKGAQSAPDVGRQLALGQRHANLRRSSTAQVPAWRGPRLTRGLLCVGRGLPLIGPSGHGGVGALQVPIPATQMEVGTTQCSRAPRTRPPSSRRSSIEPRKIAVKSALRASHAMAQAPLLTAIFHGSFGGYRKDGQGRRLAITNTRSERLRSRDSACHSFSTVGLTKEFESSSTLIL
jgi:hypothetical protein